FKYDSANWNKIYASQVINEHRLKFNKKLAIWEDLLFNLKFIAYLNKMATLSEGLYYYRTHDASVMADSKLLISRQYNLLFDAYVAFCNKNSFLTEKEAFVKERAQTCIANIFVLLKLRRFNTKFFKLSKQFETELKVLNPAIYTERKSIKRTRFNFYWLLRNKFYTLFALLYVSNYIIKNR